MMPSARKKMTITAATRTREAARICISENTPDSNIAATIAVMRPRTPIPPT
jgi:hypothetical protein